jgi:hypothetical protein
LSFLKVRSILCTKLQLPLYDQQSLFLSRSSHTVVNRVIRLYSYIFMEIIKKERNGMCVTIRLCSEDGSWRIIGCLSHYLSDVHSLKTY